jgi:hypothetical protein
MINTPKWLFILLLLWVFGTIWSNSLEPAKADLLPSSVASTSGEASTGAISGLNDPSLTSSGGLAKIGDWVSNVWKAFTFDYSWVNDLGTLGTIIRTVWIIFSVCSLYLIADIIWKIRSILLGQ